MNNCIPCSSTAPALRSDVVRRKLLQRLKCRANLINFNLAIECVRNGRHTFSYGHELLADVLGYFPTAGAERKTIQRLIKAWLDFQRDSGFRLQEIVPGGGRTQKLTTYGIDHIQPVAEWISERVEADAEYGLLAQGVLIDRYIEEGINRLPRSAITFSANRQPTSRGETSISRDNLSQLGSPSEMCRVALDCHGKGFKVFPVHSIRDGLCSCKSGGQCETKGKHPHLTDWQNFAELAGDALIGELWTKYPDANVGIKTGGTLVVIDVDPRSGGDFAWAALVRHYNINVPETRRVTTGSGGFHLYFSTPEPLRNTTLAKGVDFKGMGGYVVGPGSIHASGQKYEVENEAPIAPIPDELLQLARAVRTQKEIAEGSRHNFLMGCARAMAGQAQTHDQICAELLERRKFCALGKREISDGELRGMAAWGIQAERYKQMRRAA